MTSTLISEYLFLCPVLRLVRLTLVRLNFENTTTMHKDRLFKEYKNKPISLTLPRGRTFVKQ